MSRHSGFRGLGETVMVLEGLGEEYALGGLGYTAVEITQLQVELSRLADKTGRANIRPPRTDGAMTIGTSIAALNAILYAGGKVPKLSGYVSKTDGFLKQVPGVVIGIFRDPARVEMIEGAAAQFLGRDALIKLTKLLADINNYVAGKAKELTLGVASATAFLMASASMTGWGPLSPPWVESVAGFAGSSAMVSSLEPVIRP